MRVVIDQHRVTELVAARHGFAGDCVTDLWGSRSRILGAEVGGVGCSCDHDS